MAVILVHWHAGHISAHTHSSFSNTHTHTVYKPQSRLRCESRWPSQEWEVASSFNSPITLSSHHLIFFLSWIPLSLSQFSPSLLPSLNPLTFTTSEPNSDNANNHRCVIASWFIQTQRFAICLLFLNEGKNQASKKNVSQGISLTDDVWTHFGRG